MTTAADTTMAMPGHVNAGRTGCVGIHR